MNQLFDDINSVLKKTFDKHRESIINKVIFCDRVDFGGHGKILFYAVLSDGSLIGNRWYWGDYRLEPPKTNEGFREIDLKLNEDLNRIFQEG